MGISEKKRVRINETYEQTLELLNEHKRCIVIRPTGFGKTFILAHIMNKYKRVLYVYPNEAIKIDINTTYADKIHTPYKMITYYTLGKLGAVEGGLNKIIKNGFDLIILDEAHCAGAEMAKHAIMQLQQNKDMENCTWLGATATPTRADGFDVVDKFFNNVLCSKYTLHDCIQDKLIPRVKYIYSAYDIANIVKDSKQKLSGLRNSDTKEIAEKNIKDMEIEMANLLNVSDVLRKNITETYGKKVSYMKFMVFFSEIKILHERSMDVRKWFEEAFPDMVIRDISVVSEGEYRGNVKKLQHMTTREGTIDLIFCVNMLNMGYHIENISGVVMLRGTMSSIIYNQQIGRCMSISSSNTPIIFDFVNNLKSGYYYTGEKDNKNVNQFKNGYNRMNDILNGEDLIMVDNVAPYEAWIQKIDEIVAMDENELITYLRKNKAMPIDVLVKRTGIPIRHVVSILSDKNLLIEEEKIKYANLI